MSNEIAALAREVNYHTLVTRCKITAFDLCSEMASVSVEVQLRQGIYLLCMQSRRLGMTVQMLNKAELSMSFCSVEMFLCLYPLEKARAFNLLCENAVSV